MTQEIFSLKTVKDFHHHFAPEINNFYIVGGAIRNSLLGLPITDIDICSKLSPSELLSLCQKKKIKAIETGKDYGTITIILNNAPIEITSLRKDIEAYGRKAKVVFGTDLQEDSKRRDFSINALYLDFAQNLYDFHDGIGDLKKKLLRFIGDPETRIHEDYLRILRLYRFASQLKDFSIDANALISSIKLFPQINNLSAERISHEFNKLLAGENFYQIIKILKQENLLQYLYNECFTDSRNSSPLKNLECHFIKIMFFCKTDLDAKETAKILEKTLNLNKKQKKLLNEIKRNQESIKNLGDIAELNYLLSCYSKEECLNFLEYAYIQENISLPDLQKLRNYIKNIEVPEFPISGNDLITLKNIPTTEFSTILNQLKKSWAKENYTISREKLLSMLNTMAKSN